MEPSGAPAALGRGARGDARDGRQFREGNALSRRPPSVGAAGSRLVIVGFPTGVGSGRNRPYTPVVAKEEHVEHPPRRPLLGRSALPFVDLRAGRAAFGLLAALAVVGLLGCDDDDAAAPEPPPEVQHVDIDDPSACGACHQSIVEEWRSSMHARAHHSADPVYGAMRDFRMGREGEETAGRCAQCHGPRDPANVDSEVARGGVTCATCHNLAGVDLADGTKRGARALERAADDTLRGPHAIDSAAPAAHGTGAAAPWLTDGRTICLACHGAMQNPAGVATCTTGTEAADAEEPCTSCHMPEVDGASGVASERSQHRTHAFLGPHGLYGDGGTDFMATALAVEASFDGSRLAVTLENRTGHALPTGFPGRMMLVRVSGFDGDGEAVWHNFGDAPMREDPAAVLTKVYVDAEGAPTMPPYATRLARDSRLTPRETRGLSWEPPAAVVRVEVTVLYRLLPPPAAQRLGIADRPEATARPILTVSAHR